MNESNDKFIQKLESQQEAGMPLEPNESRMNVARPCAGAERRIDMKTGLTISLGFVLLTGIAAASGEKTQTLHSFTMKTIDGTDRPLAFYKGKVVLVVNTASECG